jgi:chromosome segregation ATPase
MSVMNVLRQHKGVAGLVFANIGVAVSLLVGAVQFLSTYEQTQADVMALHEQMDQAVRHDQLDDLRMQLDEATRDVPFQLERITRLEEQLLAATSTVDLDRIKGDLGVLKERIVFVESNLHSVQGAEDELRDIAARLAESETRLAILNDQQRQINAEHMQIGDTLKDLWEAIDERGTVPAGTERAYGY